MTPLQIVFLVIAGATLVGAAATVVARNLVHAALWLILALGGVAALFVLLEAPLLAVVQVTIYIGAIAILIIFAVMLTRRVMAESGPQTNRNWWAAALAALLIFTGLLAMFRQLPALDAAQPAALTGGSEALIEALGTSLVDVNQFVVPFEIASVLLLAALIGSIVIARPPDEPGSEEAAK